MTQKHANGRLPKSMKSFCFIGALFVLATGTTADANADSYNNESGLIGADVTPRIGPAAERYSQYQRAIVHRNVPGEY